MGNFKIILKFNFSILIVLFLSSCSQNKLDLSESNQDYHLKKHTISSEESVNLIESSKEFELKHNEIFQQDLKIKTKEYYDNLIESFIDEETGFFTLLHELGDMPFRSVNKRKTLWKLKIERYFRTTAYLTHIRNEVNIYTDGVNNQRNKGITKVLGSKLSSNLKLPIVNANSFTSKTETTENIINKINKEIIDQLADTVLGFTPEIILGILGILGILPGFKLHWSIPIVIFVLLGAMFFWRSHTRQNEIRKILKTECNKVLNGTKINYLDQLNKNTIEYYSQLQKINYEKNK